MIDELPPRKHPPQGADAWMLAQANLWLNDLMPKCTIKKWDNVVLMILRGCLMNPDTRGPACLALLRVQGINRTLSDLSFYCVQIDRNYWDNIERMYKRHTDGLGRVATWDYWTELDS